MNRLIFEDELKGNLNWNDDITLLFVNIYLKQECLWNQLHPDNKIMFRRKKAHYDMISEFKATAGISLSLCDVKKKIQSLRNSYLTQVKKMLSADSMYEPVVFSNWFHEMDRCLKTVPGHYGAQYMPKLMLLGYSRKRLLCE